MKCDEIFAALAMLEKERGIPQNFNSPEAYASEWI